MLIRISLLLASAALTASAAEHVRLTTTGGETIEGTVAAASVSFGGQSVRWASVLSLHSANAATDAEASRIGAAIAAVQAPHAPLDSPARAARDKAIDELVSFGPVAITPLLKAYKDTDQHEPRPLYRLFEKIMPSVADGFDRTLSLLRLDNGTMLRGKLPDGSITLRSNGGDRSIAWKDVRSIAVRRKTVTRTMRVHSIQHSNQIEWLDTGVASTAESKLTFASAGFVRLSWDADGWASDANGLTKPGSPAYKSNLINGHPFGAVLGRAGSAGEVFFVGRQQNKTGVAGRVQLCVNDNGHWQNNLGAFTVRMTATAAYDLGDAQ